MFDLKNTDQVQPDEIYNLGAMSHVKVSFEMSEYTAEADGVGVLRLLNAIRSAGLEKKTRLYQVCCEGDKLFQTLVSKVCVKRGWRINLSRNSFVVTLSCLVRAFKCSSELQ